MTLVADLEYFSPFTLYLTIGKFSHCIFDQYESFRKGSNFNRCTLSGPNGLVKLTIPLIGGREQKAVIRDLRIDHRERWQVQHWRTITSCYNRSPWLDYYRDDLETLYANKIEYLADWNFRCAQWICDRMSLGSHLEKSTGLVEDYPAEYRDLRARKMKNPLQQATPGTVRYPQVFEDRHGFVPRLSILDYLFCTGNKMG